MNNVSGAGFVEYDGHADKALQPIYEVGSELASVLDMNKLEGLVYLTLLRTGPITASTLSKEVGIERTKTYRIVDKLVNDGMISMTFSNPKLCIPIDPEEAIKKILKKKNDEISRINKTADMTINRVKGMVTAGFGTNLPVFRIVQGRESIYSNIEMLLDDSSDIVYIVTTLSDVSKMYHSGIPEKIKSCNKKGTKIRIIIDSTSDDADGFVKRLHITEAKQGKLPSKGRLVVSNNQMIMSDSSRSVNMMNTEFDFALFTNSIEMVNNIFSLCTFLWKTSRPLF